MNVDVEEDLKVVRVLLSRRNLRTLVLKLDGHPPDSACTIVRQCPNGWTVVVQAEEDADHYERRAPGEMHTATERKLS